MKKLISILVVIVILLTGCGAVDTSYKDYTDYTIHDFNQLKSPVVLIAKNESLGLYSIVVKDARDTIRWYGNMSSFANTIGQSRNVNDTLK